MDPKLQEAIRQDKVPYDKLVISVLEADARVYALGADEYGERNWTIDEVKASTYEAAMLRHLFAWLMGYDLDEESGESHLTHLRCCAGIVLDAEKHGTLIDDRVRGGSRNEQCHHRSDEAPTRLVEQCCPDRNGRPSSGGNQSVRLCAGNHNQIGAGRIHGTDKC